MNLHGIRPKYDSEFLVKCPNCGSAQVTKTQRRVYSRTGVWQFLRCRLCGLRYRVKP